jgi:hypothetical protein
MFYLDSFLNYHDLRHSERTEVVYLYFAAVPDGQWTWLIVVTTCAIIPSAFFVLIELLRQTHSEEEERKSPVENVAEGWCLELLVLAWVPTVMLATAPGGAASLIGNSYFCTWSLMVVLLETCVWYVHDLRQEFHDALRDQPRAYQNQQRRVFMETKQIQQAAVVTPVVEPRPSRLRTWSNISSGGLDRR